MELKQATVEAGAHPNADSKPISLILGADSLATLRSGIGRVTFEIGEVLRHSPQVSALRLWVGDRLEEPSFLDRVASAIPEASPPTPRPLRMMVGRVPGVQPLRAALKKRARQAELSALGAHADGRLLYHETNMITKPFEGATIVHVHDLSWLHHRELHPAERIKWIERNLGRTIRDATRFVAVSEFTAASFSHEFNVGRTRIDVVPNAASRSFRPRSEAEAQPSLARHDLVDRSYLLSVSTLEPRKNFDRLVAAHRALPKTERERFPLVIAGKPGWGATLENREADEGRRDGTLRLLGHQPDDVLVDLSARATCIAYVSLYEGFGLPVLEAMASGTPLIASSTTATGETAGDAALLVDPTDVEQIGEALARIIRDPSLATSLRGKGLARAAEFDWHRTASGLLASWATALA